MYFRPTAESILLAATLLVSLSSFSAATPVIKHHVKNCPPGQVPAAEHYDPAVTWLDMTGLCVSTKQK